MKRIETETNIVVRCTLNLFLIYLLQILWCAAPLETESINPEVQRTAIFVACVRDSSGNFFAPKGKKIEANSPTRRGTPQF
jgi:hypothetical protein